MISETSGLQILTSGMLPEYFDGQSVGNLKTSLCRRSWRVESDSVQLGQSGLLLHGIESHSGWFEPLARELSQKQFSSFAFDRPGWGKSSGARGHCDSMQTAKLLLRQEISRVTSITGQEIHLIGQSWGGLLALAYVLENPGAVKRLTLIAPGIFPRSESRTDKLRTVLRSTLHSPTKLHKSFWQPADFSIQPSVVSIIDDDKLRVTELSSATLRTTIALMLQVRKASLKVPALPTSTLCLLGEKDRIIDSIRTAAFMQRLGISCSIFPAAGHALALEQPRWVAERILRQ